MKYLRKFNTADELSAWRETEECVTPNVILSGEELFYNVLPMPITQETLSFNGNEYIFTDIDIKDANLQIKISYQDTSTGVDVIRNACGARTTGCIFLTSGGARSSNKPCYYVANWLSSSMEGKAKYYERSGEFVCTPTQYTLPSGEVVASQGSAGAHPMLLVIGTFYTVDTDGAFATLSDKAWIGQINDVEIKNLSGEVIHHLVPATQGSTWGMFDTVTEKFYAKNNIA